MAHRQERRATTRESPDGWLGVAALPRWTTQDRGSVGATLRTAQMAFSGWRSLMMIHLDFGVDDLKEAVQWAVAAGATVAAHQPQDDVRVMLDPEGHPFCLFLGTQ